jgi:hypothetical protein
MALKTQWGATILVQSAQERQERQERHQYLHRTALQWESHSATASD